MGDTPRKRQALHVARRPSVKGRRPMIAAKAQRVTGFRYGVVVAYLANLMAILVV